MKAYTEIEKLLAERMVEISHLFHDIANWDNIVSELETIFSQIPSNYQNEFEEKDVTYMKFWYEEDFQSFIEHEKPNNEVIWLLNAYPMCCYLLSVIQIERGQFNEAFKVLRKGIELEPDNPILLNEIGLLFCEIGKTNYDKLYFQESIKYYENAFRSRPYNTNSQKARSLRGIGFAYVELGDFENAKKLYEASLTWEESENARNEIKIINNQTTNTNAIIHSGGSNFNKAKSIYSYEYFCEQENKLPLNIKDKLPNKYVYIWSKAAKFLAVSALNFRKDDPFHYPLKEWDTKQIEIGVIQIVEYIRGITPEHYISLNTLNDVKNLLMTFHFLLISHINIQNVNNELILQAEFRHKVDNEKINLFFKVNQ